MVDFDGPSLCLYDPYEGGPDFKDNIIHMTDIKGIGIQKVLCFTNQSFS